MIEQRIQIDNAFTHWPDERLAGLYSAVALVWFQHAPALAIHVCEVVRAECERRQHNRDGGEHIEPRFFGIDFGAWSDADVGHALGLTAVLTQESSDANLGELVDSLHTALCGIAVFRLKSSGDPRDDLTFDQRWGNHDPEAN